MAKPKLKTREYPYPRDPAGPPLIEFKARKWIRGILLVSVLAVSAFVWLDFSVNTSYGTELSPIRRLFNITREDSLSSWFCIIITWMTAVTLWSIFMVQKNLNAPKATRVGWGILAGAFTYMAADDGAKIHERLGSAFGDIQEANLAEAGMATGAEGITHIFPSYSWQILFVPLFAALAVFMLIFLFRKLQTVRARIGLLVVLGLMTGAVGLDFIEGLDEEHPWNLYTQIVDTWDFKRYSATTFRRPPFDAVRHFSKSLEESMETLAMALLWCIMLAHLARLSEGRSYRLVTGREK
jgi:hypothetical protein